MKAKFWWVFWIGVFAVVAYKNGPWGREPSALNACDLRPGSRACDALIEKWKAEDTGRECGRYATPC